MTDKQLKLLIVVAKAAMNNVDLSDRMEIKQALWEVRKEIKQMQEEEHQQSEADKELGFGMEYMGDYNNQ